jgi:hypothetical protein
MKRPAAEVSIDYLNHRARLWINQNGVFIDDRVAVGWGNTKSCRHPVIGYPGSRQDHSNPRILGIDISGAVFAYHIVVKARNFLHTQQAADSARDAANHAADRATHGSAYGAAFGGTALRAGGNALSLGRERRGEQSRDHGYSEFFLHRHCSVFSVERGLNTGLREKFPRRSEVAIRCFPSNGGLNAGLRQKFPP